ncbi:MAG: A/G-specific adenine glycosylase, partial [Lachnospiraceae bacterium]|nr:A/G-specific adenine glycosylase [Lachnospiraceae bacterium]
MEKEADNNPVRMTEALIAWYEANKRSMPWREDPAPYHVYVSEIMLQQTRVDTVRAYYLRFMEALPDVFSLASCPEDRLLKLWEGLGYYSRVHNMQKAARIIVSDFGGEFPAEYEILKKLPGIGAYTASAVSSIAFHRPEPVVDGNVLRVVSRITGSRENIDLQETKSSMRAQLKSVMTESGADPSAFNQALMELGALVCLPNGEPHCADCPVRTYCSAYLEGTIGEIPVRKPKITRKKAEITAFLIFCGNSMALVKNSGKSLLSGLYELPHYEGPADKGRIAAYLDRLGLKDVKTRRLSDGRHIFTHIEWELHG